MRKLLYIFITFLMAGTCYGQLFQGVKKTGGINTLPNSLRWTAPLTNWKERYILAPDRATGEPYYWKFNLRDSISALSTSYTITAGTGISAPLVSGNYTITNTLPDVTVTITDGTGISHSGTYPNFTITNTSPNINQTISKTGSTIYLSNGGGNVHLDSTAYQPLSSQLTTLSTYNTNGLITQTASGTFTGRTITGTTNQITVTNGNGGSANPTISLPNDITISGNFKAGTFNGSALGTAAFTNSTAYEVPISFSTGLTRTVNTVTVNTSQNINTLSNLTSNGLIKTTGGTGALSIATPSTDYTIPADLSVYLPTTTAASTYLPIVGSTYTTTTGNGLAINTSTLTTGNLVSLSSTSTAAASNTQTVLNVATSGANGTTTQTTYAAQFSNTHTGTSSTNIGALFTASGGANNYAAKFIGGNGGGLILGDWNANYGGIWSTFTTPSSSNFALISAASTTILNSTSTTALAVNNSSLLLVTASNTTISNNIIQNSTVSSGTGATAGTQLNYNSLTTGNGIDASTSSLTTGMLSQFTSTSTALSGTTPCLIKLMSSGANSNSGVTATGINVSVTNTNATSGTNVAATFSASGATTANVGLKVTAGSAIFAGRLQTAKGANVASANDLTLGTDGNIFHITAATTINAITTTNWQAGSRITLIFDSTPTVKNNTAGGANTAVMLLSGGVDFSATSNDTLTLMYDGTSWYEVGRSIN